MLTRWQHPRRGLLGPAEFIDVAEHSGLVREFTLHVLDRAVRECAGWDHARADLTVAVNLSARNLLDPDLPADVEALLTRHGLPADRLVLEITETTVMSELEVVEGVLAGLRRLGVELSVDDFGTGYSSLAFLQRVAVNEIKVDRAFVAGLPASANDTAIVPGHRRARPQPGPAGRRGGRGGRGGRGRPARARLRPRAGLPLRTSRRGQPAVRSWTASGSSPRADGQSTTKTTVDIVVPVRAHSSAASFPVSWPISEPKASPIASGEAK